MKNLGISVTKFLKDDSGQDLIEYALVAALIGLGATAAMQTLAGTFGTALGNVGSALTKAIPAGN